MEKTFEPGYTLNAGDVVLIKNKDFGFIAHDIGKYAEVISGGDYFGRGGVEVKPYEPNQLFTTAKVGSGVVGVNNVVGYESFGENPLILLNTLDIEKDTLGEGVATAHTSALDKQVSGDHYKDCKIQPIEYIHANGLSYLEGNVIKYTTRHSKKNGKADIEKAIHYLELILEMEYKES